MQNENNMNISKILELYYQLKLQLLQLKNVPLINLPHNSNQDSIAIINEYYELSLKHVKNNPSLSHSYAQDAWKILRTKYREILAQQLQKYKQSKQHNTLVYNENTEKYIPLWDDTSHDYAVPQYLLAAPKAATNRVVRRPETNYNIISAFAKAFSKLMHLKYCEIGEEELFNEKDGLIIKDFSWLNEIKDSSNIKECLENSFKTFNSSHAEEYKNILAILECLPNKMLSLDDLVTVVHNCLKRFSCSLTGMRIRNNEIIDEFSDLLHDILLIEKFVTYSVKNRNEIERYVPLDSVKKLKDLILYLEKNKLFSNLNSNKRHILENMREILDLPENYHTSYIKEQLQAIQSILSAIITPYTLKKYTSDTGQDIFEVLMQAGTVSGALKFLEKIYAQKFWTGNEIRLIASVALHHDMHTIYTNSGNIAIMSPGHIPLHSNIKIITNAPIQKLKKKSKPQKGQSGTINKREGSSGTDGDDGGYGAAAGNILVVGTHLAIDKFSCSAKGSDGSDGQDAGDGGDGYRGNNGIDGVASLETPYLQKFVSWIDFAHGTTGDAGGIGGSAGYAGAKGLGGHGGKIELVSFNSNFQTDTKFEKNDKHGNDGSYGNIAESGLGGYYGRNGKDHYVIKDYSINIFSKANEIHEFQGHLSHSAVRRNIQKGVTDTLWFNNYSAPNVVYSPKDNFFSENFKRAESGKEVSKTRQNYVAAAKINTINKQSCYESLFKYFESVKQEWNVQQLNNFLRAFSSQLDNPDAFIDFEVESHTKKLIEQREQWLDNIAHLKQNNINELSVKTKTINKSKQTISLDHSIQRSTNSSYINDYDNYIPCIYINPEIVNNQQIEPDKQILINKLLETTNNRFENRSRQQNFIHIIELITPDIALQLKNSMPNAEYIELIASLLNEAICLQQFDKETTTKIISLVPDENTSIMLTEKLNLALKLSAIDYLSVYTTQILACSTSQQLNNLRNRIDENGFLLEDFPLEKWHEFSQNVPNGHIFNYSLRNFNFSYNVDALIESFNFIIQIATSNHATEIFINKPKMADGLPEYFRILTHNLMLFPTIHIAIKSIKLDNITIIPSSISKQIKDFLESINIIWNPKNTAPSKITTKAAMGAFISAPSEIVAITLLKMVNSDLIPLKDFSCIENVCEILFSALKDEKNIDILDLHQVLSSLHSNGIASQDRHLKALYIATTIHVKYLDSAKTNQIEENTLMQGVDLINIIQNSIEAIIDHNNIVTRKIEKEYLNQIILKICEFTAIINYKVIGLHEEQLRTWCNTLKEIYSSPKLINNFKFNDILKEIIILEQAINYRLIKVNEANLNHNIQQAIFSFPTLKELASQSEILYCNNITNIRLHSLIEGLTSSQINALFLKNGTIEKDLNNRILNHIKSPYIIVNIKSNNNYPLITVNNQILSTNHNVNIYIINPETGLLVSNLNCDTPLPYASFLELQKAIKNNYLIITNAQAELLPGNVKKLLNITILEGKTCSIQLGNIVAPQSMAFIKNNVLSTKKSTSAYLKAIYDWFKSYNGYDSSKANIITTSLFDNLFAMPILENKIESSLVTADNETIRNYLNSSDILEKHETVVNAISNRTDIKQFKFVGSLLYQVKTNSVTTENKFLASLLKSVHENNVNSFLALTLHFKKNISNQRWKQFYANASNKSLSQIKQLPIKSVLAAVSFLEKYQADSDCMLTEIFNELHILKIGLQYFIENTDPLMLKINDQIRIHKEYPLVTQLIIAASDNPEQILAKYIYYCRKYVQNYAQLISANLVAGYSAETSVSMVIMKHLHATRHETLLIIENISQKNGDLLHDFALRNIFETELALQNGDFRKIESQFSTIQAMTDFMKRQQTNLDFTPEQLADLWSAISACEDNNFILATIKSTTPKSWFKNIITQNFLQLFVGSFDNVEIQEVTNLRANLLALDDRLLKLFFNLFISEQFNQVNNATDPSYINYQLIDKDKLIELLNRAKFVQVDRKVLENLCMQPLTNWGCVLAEMHYTQKVNKWKILRKDTKDSVLYFLNRIRINLGDSKHEEFMEFITRLIQCVTHEHEQTLLFIARKLFYGHVPYQDVKKIVHNFPIELWDEKISQQIHQNSLIVKHRTIDEIIEKLKEQNINIDIAKLSTTSKKSRALIDALQLGIIDGKIKPSEIADYFTSLNNHQTHEEKLAWVKENLSEFTAYLSVMWWLTSNSDISKRETLRNSQLVSLLTFVLHDQKGLLQQLKTGEGKTLVVALLGAFKALTGKKVDIVSSNRDLAKDGERKCKLFYKALGLESAINCGDSDDLSKIYASHIVYGDVPSFQDHILLDKASNTNSFGDRYNKQYGLIVDEVDSMFLDKGRNTRYQSHNFAGLDHLEPLFIAIWSASLSINYAGRSSEELHNELEKISEGFEILIKSNKIAVPEYLHDYCKSKLKAWTHSAFKARFMEDKDTFIIDKTGKESDNLAAVRKIIIIDKDNGVEEYSSRWCDGLGIFLELKYKRELSSENLKSNFISNKSFFERYTDKNGSTGTLGSQAARKLLSDVYNVSMIDMPTSLPQKYIQMPSKVANNRSDWMGKICESTKEHISQQPLLIICETIREAEDVRDMIESKFPKSNIINYFRDGDNIDNVFAEQNGAMPFDVVIATNKGGRGTDIIINEKKAPKGLHVILGFIPENSRLIDQAFGRSARNGQHGSGNFIIHNSAATSNDLLHPDTFIEQERAKLDAKEYEAMSILLQEGIPQLDTEEELLRLFYASLPEFKALFQKSKFHGQSLPESVQTACMQVLQDKWAFWLSIADNDIRTINSMIKKNKIIDNFKKEFIAKTKAEITTDLETSTKFYSAPENCLAIAQEYFKLKDYKKAHWFYEKAIQNNDLTGYASMGAAVSHASIDNKNTKQNKNKLRGYLKNSEQLIQQMCDALMANAEMMQNIDGIVDVTKSVNSNDNIYLQQVEDKLRVLGLHMQQLHNVIGTKITDDFFAKDSKVNDFTISANRSTQIKQFLLSKGIIYENRVVRRWHKLQNKDQLDSILKDSFSDNLIDPISKLLQQDYINIADLEKIVFSSDELWDLLCSNNLLKDSKYALKISSSIAITETDGVDIYKQWQKIMQLMPNISVTNKNEYIELDASSKLYEELLHDNNKELLTYLLNLNLAKHTRQAKISETSDFSNIDLNKYKDCEVLDENKNARPLKEYLDFIFQQANTKNNGILLESSLPFRSKKFQVQKLYDLLFAKNLIKSGGLLKHKYDKDNTKIMSELNSLVTDKKEVKYVEQQLSQLRGSVREFQNELRAFLINYNQIEGRPDDSPKGLIYYTENYLDKFISITEKMPWWNWDVFACAMLGLVQVVLGFCLVIFSVGILAQLGTSLVVEGLGDILDASFSWYKGSFDWKSYRTKKAISLGLVILTLGFSYLATLKYAAVQANTLKKAAKGAEIAQEVVNVAKSTEKFGLGAKVFNGICQIGSSLAKHCSNHAAMLLSTSILKVTQDSLIEQIVIFMENNILANVKNDLQHAIIHLKQKYTKPEEFGQAVHELGMLISKNLQDNRCLSAEFDLIRAELAANLESSFVSLANDVEVFDKNLSEKLKGAALGVMIANEVWIIMESGINIKNASDEVSNIIRRSANISGASPVHNEALDEDLQPKFDNLNSILHNYIKKNVTNYLHRSLTKSIQYGFNKLQQKSSERDQASLDELQKMINDAQDKSSSTSNTKSSTITKSANTMMSFDPPELGKTLNFATEKEHSKQRINLLDGELQRVNVNDISNERQDSRQQYRTIGHVNKIGKYQSRTLVFSKPIAKDAMKINLMKSRNKMNNI